MKRVKYIIIFLILMLFINIGGFFNFYNTKINEEIQHAVYDRAHEIALPRYNSFELLLEEQLYKTKMLAQVVASNSSLQQEAIVEILNSTVELDEDMQECFVILADNRYYSNSGKSGIVSDDKMLQVALEDEMQIYPIDATENVDSVMLFTVPIMKKNERIAALTLTYSCERVAKLLKNDVLNENGDTLVLNKEGTVLIDTNQLAIKQDNLFSYFKTIVPGVVQTSFEDDHGIIDLDAKEDQDSLIVEYHETAQNDWFVATLVSKEKALGSLTNLIDTKQSWNIYMVLSVAMYILLISLVIFVYVRSTDKLTGLLSYGVFKKKAVKLIRGNKKQRFMVIKIDIRDFKLINRIYGFEAGDRVIKNFGKALEISLKKTSSIITRIGVDNFLFVIPYAGKEGLDALRSMFISNFRSLMGTDFIDNIEFPTGQYLTTIADADNVNIEDVYEKVNFAHQVAKQSGIDLVVDYEETIEKDAFYRKDIEDRMERALLNGEFKLYLQPKYDLHKELFCGAEALIRWVEQDGVINSPGQFLPLFEKNGFITKIDMFMFEEVAKFLRKTIDANKKPYTISVNFSRHHLRDEYLVDKLCAIADKYHVPHHLFEVELTESIVFDNIEIIIKLLRQLHEKQFTLSMDDFGSGYSSLSLLKNIEVDVLKIDKAFFDYVKNEERSQVVIKNMLKMAKELNIKTVAEGVETREQVDLLKAYDCDMIQGYYFAKPIFVDDYGSDYFEEEDNKKDE